MYEVSAFLLQRSAFSVLASWVPFVTPAPIWGYWWALVFPLVIGIAVVYKSMKCERMKHVPREATQLTLYILAAMAAGALALTLLVEVVLD